MGSVRAAPNTTLRSESQSFSSTCHLSSLSSILSPLHPFLSSMDMHPVREQHTPGTTPLPAASTSTPAPPSPPGRRGYSPSRPSSSPCTRACSPRGSRRQRLRLRPARPRAQLTTRQPPTAAPSSYPCSLRNSRLRRLRLCVPSSLPGAQTHVHGQHHQAQPHAPDGGGRAAPRPWGPPRQRRLGAAALVRSLADGPSTAAADGGEARGVDGRGGRWRGQWRGRPRRTVARTSSSPPTPMAPCVSPSTTRHAPGQVYDRAALCLSSPTTCL